MKKLFLFIIIFLLLITFVWGQKSGLLAVTRKSNSNIILYPDGTWQPLKEAIQIDNEWKLVKQGSIKIADYKIDDEEFLIKTIYNNSTNKTYKKLFVKVSLYDQNSKLINSNEKPYYGRATPGSTKRRNIHVKYKGKAPLKITIEISKAIVD